MVVLALSFVGCRNGPNAPYAANTRNQASPPYFSVMDRGVKFEHKKEYTAAIRQYEHALTLADTVDTEIRINARIAIHNRLAACHRKMGDASAALREFRISARLGDAKYAPKAIAELLRTGAGSRH